MVPRGWLSGIRGWLGRNVSGYGPGGSGVQVAHPDAAAGIQTGAPWYGPGQGATGGKGPSESAGVAPEDASGALHAVTDKGSAPIRVDYLNGAPEPGCRDALSRVGTIAPGVYEAQITNPVVGPIPVDVVYQEGTGVSPMMQVPCNPVGLEKASVQPDLEVATRVQVASGSPGWKPVTGCCAPREGAGFRAVGEGGAEPFQGRERLGLGHGAKGVSGSIAGEPEA